MDKTYRREFVRLYIVDHLPEPLTPRDGHLQIYDNYIASTALRLRKIRVPETKEWTRILEKHVRAGAGETKTAAIFLADDEYRVFENLEGREVRKNRYYWEVDGRTVDVDVYLGELAGLTLARVTFETVGEMDNYEFPSEAIEVTGEDFFDGRSLAGKTAADVAARLAKNGGHAHDIHVREAAKDSE